MRQLFSLCKSTNQIRDFKGICNFVDYLWNISNYCFRPLLLFLYDVCTYEKRGSHEIIYLQTHEKNHSKTLRFLYSIDFLILVTRGLIFTMYWKWRFLKRKQTLLPFVVDFHDWRFHKDFSTIFRGLTYNLFIAPYGQ